MTETDRTPLPTPELRFLLDCFREGADHLAGAAGEDLSAARVVELAGLHGLGPLLSDRLTAGARTPLAEELLQLLAPTVARAQRVALQLSGELVAVLDLFRSHDVAAIPYKGPVLAAELYGKPSLRSYRDLDLLIHPEDLGRARKLLAAREYRPLYAIAPRFEAAHLATGYHLNLARDRDGMLLELHWRVADPYFSALGSDGLLWEGLREVSFLGRPVSALAPESLLLCLAVHGAKHHWDRLSHVVDVATLVRGHPGLDFERLLRAARHTGSLRRLQVAFRLAERLTGLALPPTWGEDPHDPAAEQLAAHFAWRLSVETPPAPGLLAHARIDLAGMDGSADRARYLCGILAPNVSDWANSPLPPALSPVLPLLRPFRLLRRYGLLHRTRPEK